MEKRRLQISRRNSMPSCSSRVPLPRTESNVAGTLSFLAFRSSLQYTSKKGFSPPFCSKSPAPHLSSLSRPSIESC